MAIKDYTQYLKIEPTDPEGYFYRGECFAKENLYESAIKDFTKVIELTPDNMDAYINRAQSYLKIKKTRKACNDYRVVCSQGNCVDFNKQCR